MYIDRTDGGAVSGRAERSVRLSPVKTRNGFRLASDEPREEVS